MNAADTAIAIEPRELTIDPTSYTTPLDAALAAVQEANDAWKSTSGAINIDDDNLRVRVDVLTSKTEGSGPDVVGLLESAGLYWKDAVGHHDIVPQVEAPRTAPTATAHDE